MLASLVPVLALCVSALAIPSKRSPSVVHEKRSFIPSHWEQARGLDKRSILPMRIGLKQSNIENLEAYLMEISHPDSPMYGQHWTPERIAKTFAPSQETVDTVWAWLADSGISPSRLKLTNSKGWIEFNSTVEEAENLLDAEYSVYEHTTGAKHVACTSYSVPAHVTEHIEMISPTVHFDKRIEPPQKRSAAGFEARAANSKNTIFGGPSGAGSVSKEQLTKTNLSTCNELIVPDCLRALYHIDYKPIATKKNSYGIVEYTPNAFLPTDLDMFFKNFSDGQVGQRPALVSIDGGEPQTIKEGFNENGESDLDLEYAMTLTNPQNITLLQAGDLVQGASFNNLLDALDASYCTFEGGDDPNEDGIYPDPAPGGFDEPESCGIIKPPNVISTSFGMTEADVTPFYANRQCNEYGKLGLMGVTILYASGDQGVASFGDLCLNPDGTQSVNGTIFNPTFPSGCPFVTSVGATMIPANGTVDTPETACEEVIFSGGGFSNVFARPAFQQAAVHNFLTKFPPNFPAGTFNTSNSRAFPDVSANGANYVIAVDGEFERVFGTSASSPVFGSIITLINDARLAINKKPVGFINPVIYTPIFAAAFNDITVGGNQGCGTPGFESSPGWDPVTGLGTPNFNKLLALWLLLP